MLEKIKIYFLSRKKFLERKDEVERLIQANEKLTKEILEKSTPELVLRKVMHRGIEWYDYDELNVNEKKMYFSDIQAVIKNKPFINELNHLIADQVEYIARESKNHEDTMNVRMTINAIDMIKERLESVANPKELAPTRDEINEAI